jgi:hypothetical protein
MYRGIGAQTLHLCVYAEIIQQFCVVPVDIAAVYGLGAATSEPSPSGADDGRGAMRHEIRSRRIIRTIEVRA